MIRRQAHFGTAGDAVEAIFFVVAILLRLKIDLVTIVLVSGSALLVFRSKKFVP